MSRTTKAVNYRHHSGSTKLDFRGTDLMPKGSGEAKVESRTGRIEINADFDHLQPANSFGPEYLTYVLWAITPEGRPANLGEVVPKDGRSSLRVSTDLQAFGLIVTAEPYFAVTGPGNLVVVENVLRPNTKGWEQPIDAKFDAIERGQYTIDINPASLPATSSDPKTPNDLLQARNAIAIARAEGAERYAPDALSRAEDFLRRGEDYLVRKQGSKAIGTVARGAVQAAEDARVLSIQKRQREQQEAERRAMEQREEQARMNAEQARQLATEEKARAEQEVQERAQAEKERQAAEQAKAQAEVARQQAEQARLAAEAQQRALQIQAQQAQQTAQQAEQARVQAEQARSQAQQQEQQTRQRLLEQLNQVLQTRETARGLIVDMPDVLFDTGKYTLKSGARERLARVAGIVLAYPDLHVQVEGHTDNVGSAEYNQQLSEQRANTVREYLTSQGVKPENIDSHGFGLTQPIASNDTAAGRQLNRRVDLVVTGQVLGNVVTKSQSTQTETVTKIPTVDEGQGVVTPTPGSSVGQPSAVPSQTPPQGSQSLPPQWI